MTVPPVPRATSPGGIRRGRRRLEGSRDTPRTGLGDDALCGQRNEVRAVVSRTNPARRTTPPDRDTTTPGWVHGRTGGTDEVSVTQREGPDKAFRTQNGRGKEGSADEGCKKREGPR